MAISKSRKKTYLGLIIMGIISGFLYAGLLLRQDFINGVFSKGGIYAFLPILTAFIFSYFHGGFTERFWSVLGIEAKNKKEAK